MNHINENTRWVTNLQRMFARGVTDDSIILVKLLTFTKGTKCEHKDKVYAARFIKNADNSVWHIYDYVGSELLIPVENDSIQLGSIIVDNEDDENSKTIYVVTSCYPLSPNCCQLGFKYYVRIKETGEIAAHTETRREASNIAYALKQCGIETTTVSLHDIELCSLTVPEVQ